MLFRSDSTGDGILVINQEGRMAGYNKKLLAIWNLPPSLIEAKHYQEMLNAVLWQIKDPEASTASSANSARRPTPPATT